jgi:poly(3-hydroxybutyrate) depolymerase
MHGLTLQVFGERGGLRWAQEQPNQLHFTPLGQPTRTLERGYTMWQFFSAHPLS